VTGLKRDPFDPAYIDSGSAQDKRLAKIFEPAISRHNESPTLVRIVDRFAYLYRVGTEQIECFLVPAEAYDQLARWEEYGLPEDDIMMWLAPVPPEMIEDDDETEAKRR
jgi:hypothetical protein